MNKLVVCILVYFYTYGVLDVCSTLADQTVLNYSGLNIAFKLKGGRPWMLKLLVMAVYLIACSHVRISSCSASTPLFSYQRVWECFTGGYQGPAPQRWGKRAEQQPRVEPNIWWDNRTVGKGWGDTHTSVRTHHHVSILRSYNAYCRLYSTCWEVNISSFSHRHTRNHPPYSSQAL